MTPVGWARLAGATGGTVGGAVLGYSLARAAGIHPGQLVIVALTGADGLIFGYLSAPYVVATLRGFDHWVKTTPLPDVIAGMLGLIVGLVTAVLIGYFVREFPYGVALSTILAALLALAGANAGMNRRAEFVALLRGPAPDSAAVHRIPAALVDTSAIIDGRIRDLTRSGFVDWKLVVPRCILLELQQVADSGDDLRRARGRRGLEVLSDIQEGGKVELELTDDDLPGPADVDAKLLRMAKAAGYAILTTDFNLGRVAKLEGIRVLNINELANAMRPMAVPGEEVTVMVAKEGKESGQGVGYLSDGTMVVIEQGRSFVNQTVTATVVSVLQTAAGRMVFAQAQPARREAG